MIATPAKSATDRAEIVRAFSVFMEPGQITELRALDCQLSGDRYVHKTASGYFDNAEALAKAAAQIISAKGVYFIPNRVNPALHARAANRIRGIRNEPTTSDDGIERRLALLIDVDCNRPAGISASDDEHEAALAKAREIREALSANGWPDPVLADSGNGAHLVYRIDLPPDSPLVEQCLRALDARFSDQRVKVDVTVHNPARIWKLYGTLAAKGDSTEARPHRMSRIIDAPENREIVPVELLEELAGDAPQTEAPKRTAANGKASDWSIDEWIRKHAPDFKGPEPGQRGARKWVADKCPWNSDHADRSAFILERAGGEIVAGCHHNGCDGKDWHALRDLRQPGWREAKEKRKRERKPKVEAPAAIAGKPLAVNSREGQTDKANSQRLVKLHGDKLLYCHPWKRWLSWNGKRWELDNTGAPMRLAKQVAEFVFREALKSGEQTGLDFAVQTANVNRLNAMLTLAQSDLPVAHEDFDKNEWLLNVDNGTLDLRTGELREHRREDLITQLCPTAYNREASTYNWDQFLDAVFVHQSMIDFIKRLMGYCLTGSIREQTLPIFWGSGSNGKSTFLEAFLFAIGGDYTTKSVPDLLLVKNNESHPTERADLFRKRLVVCVETSQGRSLNESLVKELSGGDRIRARRLYENFWEFDPSHTPILCTNHMPQVRGTDHAIWRRLALVPFTVTFWDPDKGETGPPELKQNKALRDLLRSEAEGILAWAVQGCLDWQKHGLAFPGEVLRATDQYRQDQDVVSAFIVECCITNPGVQIRAGKLFEAYQEWSKREGHTEISGTAFGETILAKNFKRKISNGKWYLGIALRELAQD